MDDVHIMISYQWNQQDLILRVRDRLREQGYKIWIDVEQMGGSTLEAMARAVEQSRIVIIAMSHSYKDSSNTRAGGWLTSRNLFFSRTTMPRDKLENKQ